jgi:hypothetical protein
MSTNPIVNVIIVLGAGAVAALISFAIRRLVPQVEGLHTGSWSSTLSYVATAYGVIVGFSILLLFGAFSDARFAVGDEATSIGTAFEEMRVFGEDGVPVQRALICYARVAAEDDWPAMQERSSSPAVDRAYTGIIEAVGEVDAPTSRTFQPAVTTNVMVQVGNISTAREARLVTARAELNGVMWGLLWGGGILVVVLIFAVTVPASARSQAVLVGLAATFTAVMLLLVVALNNPFAGDAGRVSPALIEQTATSMENELPAGASDPCPPA